MKDDEILISLLSVIKTKEDKLSFLAQLNNLNQLFYSQGKDIQSFMEVLPYRKKEKLLSLAKEQGIDMHNNQAIQSFIMQIMQLLQKSKEVNLTIAFEPSEEIITKLSTWFVVNLKKAVILDITVDPTLIGGIIIGYNGFYKDISLKKVLLEKYQQKQLDFISFFHE